MDIDPVGQLDREWRQLASGALRAQLREWAEHDPTLAAFANPGRLIRFLRRPGPWAARDAVLGALLWQARVDPLAARVVLEAVLPGLKRIAERVILDARDRDELWAHLLACAWEQIRTYSLERRPSKIAANLLLDTRRAALDQFMRERSPRAGVPDGALVPPASDAGPAVDVEEPLGRAIAAGAVSSEEADLILRTRIDDVPLASLAAESGVSYDALRVRRSRAERRLLLFLGQPDVRFGGRKPHCLGARVAGAGSADCAGGGDLAPADRRR